MSISLGEQLRGAENNPELQREIISLYKLKQRAEAEGVDPLLTEPRKSLFFSALDVLDTPKQWTQGVLDSAFIRKDLADVGLFGAAKRGADEDITGADMLRRAGLQSPIGRAVLGFGMDVFLDPLIFGGGATKGLASAAGRKLSKTGLAFKNELVKDTIGAGIAKGQLFDDAVFAANEVAETSFKGLSRLEGILKKYPKADAGEAIMLAHEATSALQQASPALARMGLTAQEFASKTPVEALGKIKELFPAPGLSVNVGMPFLGHLQGKASYALRPGDGAVRKTLKTIGNIVKPGRLQLASVDTAQMRKGLELTGAAPAFDATYGAVKQLAQAGLDAAGIAFNVGKNAAQKVPGVKTISAGVGEMTDAVGTTFKKIFAKNLLPGMSPNAIQRDLEFKAKIAGVNDEARHLVVKMFPDSFREETYQAARASTDLAAHAMEASGLQAMKGLADGLEQADKGLAKDLLEAINLVAGGAADDMEIILPQADDLFRKGLEAVVNNPETPSDVVENIVKTIKHFDSLRAEEMAMGIKVGLLDSYLPHIYMNQRHGKLRGTAASFQFTKSRKYNSLKEALLDGGLVGRTDLEGLVYHRTRKSLIKRAEKQHFIRMGVEEGYDAKTYSSLFRQADTNPLLAKAMKRRGLSIPTQFTPEELEQARKIYEKSAPFEKMAADAIGAKILESGAEKVQRAVALAGDNQKQLAFQFINDENAELFYNIHKNFEDEVQHQVLANGVTKPLASARTSALDTELARAVVDKDGVATYLPKSIADMYEDSVSRRDSIRAMLGNSEIGLKMLDLHDSSLNAMKKLVTLPFISYWSRNLFGDGLFRLMDGGIEALDPGHMAVTYNLLKGKESLLSASGQTYTPDLFKRIAKESGIQMRESQYLEILDDASSILDIEKFILKQKGIRANLRRSPSVALEVAQERMRDRFENFFRLNHLAHRLKVGDTIPDAIRRTNEALINYGDLTEIERSFFRRAFMFWGWTSKASKKAVSQLFRNPGDITIQLHAARGVAEGFSEPDAPPTPDEIGVKTLASLNALEQIAFPLGRDREGKVLMGRGFGLPVDVLGQNLSIYLPRKMSLQEIADTAYDSTVRSLQKQAALSNPGLKNLVEAISQKNLYFDAPLDAKFLRRLPQWEKLARAVAPHKYNKIPAAVGRAFDDTTLAILGGGRDSEGNLFADPGRYWLLTQTIPAIARLVGTARDLTRTDIPLPQKLIEQVSGVRVSAQDVSRSLAHRQRREIEDQLEENKLRN